MGSTRRKLGIYIPLIFRNLVGIYAKHAKKIKDEELKPELI